MNSNSIPQIVAKITQNGLFCLFYADGETQVMNAASPQAAEEYLKNRGFQVLDRAGQITLVKHG